MHTYTPDGPDPWIPAMKKDVISTTYSFIRNIDIVIPAGIAFLILLAIPKSIVKEDALQKAGPVVKMPLQFFDSDKLTVTRDF